METQACARVLAGLAVLFVLIGVTGLRRQEPGPQCQPNVSRTYIYTVSVTDGTLTHSATYSLGVTVK